MADRAGLGKFLVAGDAALERVHYGNHGEWDGHDADTKRVLAALGPGGFGAAARPGRHPALGPGGFGAGADADRAWNDVRLLGVVRGRRRKPKPSGASYPWCHDEGAGR